MTSLIYGIKKKTGTNELICKTEVDLLMQKTNLWLPGDKVGGINWEIGVENYTTMKKQIIGTLLQSTWNSTQYSVMTYMGKEDQKKGGYICIQLIHFAVRLKLT